MTATLRELFEAELREHKIRLCEGGCEHRSSHKRGFVIPAERTVHYSAKVATRATLLAGLHEVGHVVMTHGRGARRRRWQEEQQATDWAVRRMRELGVAVPRKEIREYAAYVARMKRWGDHVAAGRAR